MAQYAIELYFDEGTEKKLYELAQKISPVMNRGMYQFQSELHESMKEFDSTGWEWYCPDCWVPHCTIALTRDDEEEVFYRASDLVLHEFKKISGEFSAIGLIKAFPVEEIFMVKLST